MRQFENADELTKEDIDMANCQVLGRSCKKRCRKQPRLLPPQKNCTVVDEEICREVTEEKCAEVDEEVCEDFEEELCDEQVKVRCSFYFYLEVTEIYPDTENYVQKASSSPQRLGQRPC